MKDKLKGFYYRSKYKIKGFLTTIMSDKKKKYTFFGAIVLLFVLLIILIFVGKSFVEKNTKNLHVKYQDSDTIELEKVRKYYSIKKDIIVENKSKQDVYYNLMFDKVVNNIKTNDLYYNIYDGNGDTILSDTMIPLTGDNLNILNYNYLKKHKKDKYTIEIVYDGKTSKKDLVIKFKVTETNKVEDSPLIKDMKEKYSKSLTEVDGAYYFKGNSTGNYLQFGGYNYRVVAINKDNSLRLIMDDKLSVTSSYKDEYEVNNIKQAVKLLDYKNSSIKDKLNYWYTVSFANDEARAIVTGEYCNDLNYNRKNVLDVYTRVKNKKPTLKCSNKIQAYVGLLSADEALIGGLGFSDKDNSSESYLYTNKYNWYLGSPSEFDKKDKLAKEFYVSKENGKITSGLISNEYTIRPVINIKSDLNYDGEGTEKKPYKLK